MQNVFYISLKEAVRIHRDQIILYGGILGIRDLKLLDSSINGCRATFDKKDLYVTLFDKAAVLAFSIINNHPFIDGNKRTGIVVSIFFLVKNGYKLCMSSDDLYEFTIKIATSKLDISEVSKIFKSNSIKIKK